MKILISGAGIAGLTAAWWLSKQGHEIEMIEIAKDLRDEGYMMDFFGPGYEVAQKMNILDSLKKKSHQINSLSFVNKKGGIKSGLSYSRLVQLVDRKYLLLMRGDLVDVLHEQLPPGIKIHYATSLESLQQEQEKVKVRYTNGKNDSFDLLIGADGVHSRLRELAFGPEEQFRKYMGYYVASFILHKDLRLPQGPDKFYAISEPNKQAIIYPVDKQKYAPFFIWRTCPYPSLNPEEQHGVVKGLFQNIGWLVPEVCRELNKDTHLYFDTVSQIHMENWSKGRVVLVGDACACLSLLAGQGSSFAMAGAYYLAESIRQADNKLPKAFQLYESRLRPIIDKKQQNAQKFSASFVPKSRLAMKLRDIYFKIMFYPPFRKMTQKQLGGENNELIY